VVCPWHGSTFRLSDGAVVRGPAATDQPLLRTRVISGRVQAALP
jgi:nitrite reductase/ring-hydroxylating ferredoxin subunit